MHRRKVTLYGMAQLFNPKDALQKNRVNIVKGLANADGVADHLFQSDVFDNEMRDAVQQEKEKEKKNRKILDTLHYRGDGKKAVKALYDAFVETNNKDLAKYLEEYVKFIERDENRFSPSEWPPSEADQEIMESDSVIRIKDVKSPFVVDKYTNSKVYKMRNKIRGVVFMINNIDFKKLRRRDGSDIDAKNLRKLFKELQFEVVETTNKGGQDMLQFLVEERDKVDWTEMECMILIVMSHGDTDGIYGVDSVAVQLTKMTDIFKECPGLNEKPKLVFVQACRGKNPETDQTTGVQVEQTKGVQVADEMSQLSLTKDESDAVKSKTSEIQVKTVHSEADFLIAYATPEGTPAYRNTKVGSWFLNAIVWTFKYHADQQEIQHLLLKVNYLVSQGRTMKGHLTVSEISNKLRKNFYFFPGIYDDPPKLLED